MYSKLSDQKTLITSAEDFTEYLQKMHLVYKRIDYQKAFFPCIVSYSSKDWTKNTIVLKFDTLESYANELKEILAKLNSAKPQPNIELSDSRLENICESEGYRLKWDVTSIHGAELARIINRAYNEGIAASLLPRTS